MTWRLYESSGWVLDGSLVNRQYALPVPLAEALGYRADRDVDTGTTGCENSKVALATGDRGASTQQPDRLFSDDGGRGGPFLADTGCLASCSF